MYLYFDKGQKRRIAAVKSYPDCPGINIIF